LYIQTTGGCVLTSHFFKKKSVAVGIFFVVGFVFQREKSATMGDVVEQILERQIPALRDLVDRRLMTTEEVKGIVEQRRQFECELFFARMFL
jgi:hypothetical protein